MILLWGIANEGPLEAVHDSLQRRSAPLFLLNQRDVLKTEMELHVNGNTQGAIRIGNRTCDLAAVTAVYARPYDSRHLQKIEEAGEAALRHAGSFDAILSSWLELTPALVINPASAMASNNSKPYQLSLIRALGFDVPDTLVTTDPCAAQAFWDRHGTVVYKSLSGVRSIVSRLSPEHASRLADVRWAPTQFQQYIPGHDYRVHVVGNEVFTREIVSSADDYRYAARQGRDVELRAYELPGECADRCRRAAASLGLYVAGLDLRRTPDGRWCCFEVNPSPAFTYYQSGTEISDAIAGLLLQAG